MLQRYARARQKLDRAMADISVAVESGFTFDYDPEVLINNLYAFNADLKEAERHLWGQVTPNEHNPPTDLPATTSSNIGVIVGEAKR